MQKNATVDVLYSCPECVSGRLVLVEEPSSYQLYSYSESESRITVSLSAVCLRGYGNKLRSSGEDDRAKKEGGEIRWLADV